MHAGEEKTVKLKSPIPVYLGYWTARVRPDDTVQFRKDVYDVDGRLPARLADRLERLRQQRRGRGRGHDRQPDSSKGIESKGQAAKTTAEAGAQVAGGQKERGQK